MAAATPRARSNIISYVDAARLKASHMVKLPVIVYNHRSSREVISNAIQLRNVLERQAGEERRAGGDYIRPIVLFQAESNTGQEDRTTFDEIKKRLVHLGIDEHEIAIKTATVNELKDVDLLAPTCPIRYIITVNALKEGWDCSFAYILATIANRHSQVDVEQIVGRVLRQPYARQQHHILLNNSYVLASSVDFINTLNRIVVGLNQAGFSERDMRAEELEAQEEQQEQPATRPRQQGLYKQPPAGTERDEPEPAAVQAIVERAERASREYEQQTSSVAASDVPTEVREKMNTFTMVSRFVAEAEAIRLPRFFVRVPNMSLFGDGCPCLTVRNCSKSSGSARPTAASTSRLMRPRSTESIWKRLASTTPSPAFGSCSMKAGNN